MVHVDEGALVLKKLLALSYLVFVDSNVLIRIRQFLLQHFIIDLRQSLLVLAVSKIQDLLDPLHLLSQHVVLFTQLLNDPFPVCTSAYFLKGLGDSFKLIVADRLVAMFSGLSSMVR
jgi:hypothetical protein